MASARQRGKTWTGLFRDVEGRQRSAGAFPTKRQALAAARTAEALGAAEKRTDVYSPGKPGSPTVAGYADTWLPAHRLSDHAKETYGTVIRHHILPAIGHTEIRKVTPQTLRTWFRRLENDGASGALLAKIKTVLSAMLQSAAEDGLISQNPARGIRLPKDARKRRRALSAEECRRLLSRLDEPYRGLVELVMNSGLRWEEATAVRGSDIEGDVLHVQRVLMELKSPHRFVARESTKNGSHRDVVLPGKIARRIREADGFAFLRPDGSHIPIEYFRRWVWLPALRAEGLDGLGLTPRDLRRTHATLLRSGGADLEVVRQRLGHSSIAVTDRYLDTRPSLGQQALTALSVALGTREES